MGGMLNPMYHHEDPIQTAGEARAAERALEDLWTAVRLAKDAADRRPIIDPPADRTISNRANDDQPKD